MMQHLSNSESGINILFLTVLLLAGDWWGRHQCTPLVLILKVREVKLRHTVSAATADFIGEGTII